MPNPIKSQCFPPSSTFITGKTPNPDHPASKKKINKREKSWGPQKFAILIKEQNPENRNLAQDGKKARKEGTYHRDRGGGRSDIGVGLRTDGGHAGHRSSRRRGRSVGEDEGEE